MSGYSQPAAKRQKVRETRPGDNVDYFQGIDKVEFNSMAAASDSASYRYFSPTARVHSRAMNDWLRCSVSLTDFKQCDYDYHGRPNPTRAWDDGSNTLENYKRCIKAFFDFCLRLGVRYWTAFDTDLVPWSEGDDGKHWDEIVEYLQELDQKTHLKLLWIAPDLHSNPRYSSGAFTSNEASTFTHAATQIKRCLEVSQRLSAESFLLWPYREGYHRSFLTDVSREIKLFAKLLKVTAEYKDRLNYRCQLLIMPYYRQRQDNHNQENDTLNRYMWDVTSCLYMLKHYSLERYYKVCAPPGHQMYMANVYNMLGGVVITDEVDPYDTKTFTLMMKSIIDQGAPPTGGAAIRLRAGRCGARALVAKHVLYVDAIARGLRLAANMHTEQTLANYLQQRYTSYYSGFGSRLTSSDVTMEECEDHCKKNQAPPSDAQASKPEQMDLLFQRYLDTSEHV